MIDGPVLVADALAAGVALEEVFVDADQSSRPETLALIGRAEAAGAEVFELPPGALARLTQVVHPPGIAAIAPWRFAELPDATGTSLVVVAAGVSDPGNAGTLLRTAEAAGASAVVFCEGAVDPTNPKCVRASAGALFYTAVVVLESAQEVLDSLGKTGHRRISTVLGSAQSYDEADLTGPIALVLGSEAHGLPRGLESSIDESVTIPMVGRGESLNVAMAGSIICFEVLRQRRATGRRSGDDQGT